MYSVVLGGGGPAVVVVGWWPPLGTGSTTSTAARTSQLRFATAPSPLPPAHITMATGI